MSDQSSEEFKYFIRKLQNEGDRPVALQEIKRLIELLPANKAALVIREGGISEIIQCLNIDDEVQVHLTCETLEACFAKFQPGDVVKIYISQIMYLLRHEKNCARRIAMDEIYKALKVGALQPVTEYSDVFVAVAQMLSDTDLAVTDKAIKISSELPLEAYPRVLDAMNIGLSENSSSGKCNILEVIVNICSKSEEHFNLCAGKNYIDFMIGELRSDDLLYQVNILELLSRLVVIPQGINYLVKNGGLTAILEYENTLKDNPFRSLLISGYLKFVGCITHTYPKEIFAKYTVMLDALFEAFDTNDQSVLPIALDTLGLIGSSIEGKLCLAALGSRYTQTIERVTQIIRDSATEIKVRSLLCFAALIAVDNDLAASKTGPVDHRVTLMTREWFRALDSNAMEYLLQLCKTPFTDIRQAAFVLLDAVCQHRWGEDFVARTAGFVEFLLDRSIVYTKDINEAKYDIIKRLSTSESFDVITIGKLQTYVEQGPFYSESTPLEVALVEGEN